MVCEGTSSQIAGKKRAIEGRSGSPIGSLSLAFMLSIHAYAKSYIDACHTDIAGDIELFLDCKELLETRV